MRTAKRGKKGTHRLELVQQLLRGLLIPQILLHSVQQLGFLATEILEDKLIGERQNLLLDDVLREVIKTVERCRGDNEKKRSRTCPNESQRTDQAHNPSLSLGTLASTSVAFR